MTSVGVTLEEGGWWGVGSGGGGGGVSGGDYLTSLHPWITDNTSARTHLEVRRVLNVITSPDRINRHRQHD